MYAPLFYLDRLRVPIELAYVLFLFKITGTQISCGLGDVTVFQALPQAHPQTDASGSSASDVSARHHTVASALMVVTAAPLGIVVFLLMTSSDDPNLCHLPNFLTP